MSNKANPVRAQLILPFLIMTIFMLVAWTLTQWHILDRMVQSQRGHFSVTLAQGWRAAVDNTANAQETLLYQITKNKRLKTAFLTKDREALMEITAPILTHFRRSASIGVFYFHETDGTNFLRVHQPSEFGDTITRKTFALAKERNATVSGLETSAYGRTVVRSVTPWYDGTQLIGFIELGTLTQPIIEWLGDSEDVELALMIPKSLIDEQLWKKANNDTGTNQWADYKEHLLVAHTGQKPAPDLSAYYNIEENKITLDKNTIGSVRSRIDIFDIKNNHIGNLLVTKDFSWLVKEFSSLVRNIITIFLTLIFLTTLLYLYFARRLTNQLNFNMRALHTEIESRIAAEESLKEHQKNLEEKVSKRTQELSTTNQQLKDDIELREQTERQLAESTQKYRALFNGSTDIILVIRDNKLIDGNVTAHNTLDIGNATMGRTLTLDNFLSSTEEPPTHSNLWLREAQEEGLYRAEMMFHGAEQKFPVDTMITYINEDDSSLFLIACRDISERKAAQAKVEYQALYDPLTDLPNRRLFMEELHRATQLCRRQNQKGALLFIDLDHFKNINDTLGHSVGDKLLEKVAKRLKESVRAEDTVARFGGDEFVIILPCCGEDNEVAGQNARVTAEKVSQNLICGYTVGEHQLHVTPSVGIAIFPKLNETSEDILKQADAALYGAKGAGRNTIRFFEPKMQDANEKRLALEKELRNAIDRDQMFINLQTKHDPQGNVIGSECLLRWKHPEMGMVSPFHFITVAEETGFITHIGKWVIEQVGQWVAYCKDHNLPEVYQRVAINLSPLQLFQKNFINELWAIVQQYKISPELITLEITENVLIKDFDSVIKLLQKLKDLGFMISVDDFGTGYSSLKYLKSLPIDELKIDQSFVREIHTNPSDRAIADTIISMARHLSLKVVAEGVEIPEQLALLAGQGCERFQGYHFARPITTGELLEKIQASKAS